MINNPNVIPLLDSFEDEEYMIIVQQLANHGNLNDLLKKGYFKNQENRIRHAIRQIVVGNVLLYKTCRENCRCFGSFSEWRFS